MDVFHLSLARLLAFGTPLGAAQGLCFGFTLGNVTFSHCAFTWPSVNTCSESRRGSSTPRAQQGSLATRSLLEFWVPVWRDPLSTNPGPVSRSNGGDVRQAFTHQEVEGENKAWWIIQEVKYSKWQTKYCVSVAVCILRLLISVCGWKNNWNQQHSVSKQCVVW